MFQLSSKQQHFLNSKLKWINILEGSVSSGKTYVSLVFWGLYVSCCPLDHIFLMTGKTLTTLRRNCLTLLQTLFGERNFHYSLSTKTGILFNHLVYLEGADNELAEDKIRGITINAAYLDEITLLPESFFTMLLSRLRTEGAFILGTTNPDNPMHWLKAHYLDRPNEIDIAVWDFFLEDNSFLPEDYVENIKKAYTGVFYKRFIQGQWVIADGLVYSAFNEQKHIISTPSIEQINSEYAEKYIGIDYGIENPTCYSLWGWHWKKEEWHCLREYYFSGRDTQRPKTDVELYADLVSFSSGITGIQGVVIDPSASSLIVYIIQQRHFRVFKADNDVLPGITYVNACFEQNKVKICNCCINAKKELYSYSWDTDKSKRIGKDVVIKQNDHFCDSMRYFFYTIVKPKTHLYGIAVGKLHNSEEDE